jgi:hypothetical protein
MIKEKHQAYQSLSSQNIKQLLLDWFVE